MIAWTMQKAWWALVRLWFRFAHRLEVEGIENLPEHPPFVIVANHESHLDLLAIAAALKSKHRSFLFPLAAGDTFFEKLPLRTFSAFCLNALPIWRKRCDPNDLQQLRTRLIEDGCIFAIFPEGTRTRTGEMGRFKRGIGVMVAGTAVPVVPAYIDGAFEALPPKAKMPRLAKISVTFGAQQDFSEVANNSAGSRSIADALQQAIEKLRDNRLNA